MRPSAAIETDQLTRVFSEPRGIRNRAPGRQRTALDGLTIRIEPGECVALVGPNGAGKSTLLRILATAVLPTSGDALVAGRSVAREPAAVRKAIGVLTGDERSFFWRLTGLENLLFFGRLHGLAPALVRARADELLERLGLSNASDMRFVGYSSGMRLRLGIARAVLHEPPILLLDEPTSRLDIDHRRQVLDVLREAVRPDGAALIASHDAGLAAALAHRIIRLEQGRVTQELAGSHPRRYAVVARGIDPTVAAAIGDTVIEHEAALHFTVLDLGDGFALSAALASIVAAGGEIASVGEHGGQP